MLDLCTSLRVPCVAEHIERPEQLEMLRALKCRDGQGFALSPPLPAEEARALAAAKLMPFAAGKGRARGSPRRLKAFSQRSFRLHVIMLHHLLRGGWTMRAIGMLSLAGLILTGLSPGPHCPGERRRAAGRTRRPERGSRRPLRALLPGLRTE